MANEKPTPIDCVQFGLFQKEPYAQANVANILGDYTGDLYRTYASLGTPDEEKKIAAKEFADKFGFHPQKVREIIQKTNAYFEVTPEKKSDPSAWRQAQNLNFDWHSALIE